MVHHRNLIILAIVAFILFFSMASAQVEPPLKPGNPGLPGCLANVEHLEQIIADQNLMILDLQEQLDAMKNYAPVPQTGQTKCYDPYSEAEIPCANTGQDGDLEKGVVSPDLRFTDNNDGTVTDNLTRLVWTKNAATWNVMRWDSALSVCGQLADDSSSLTDGSQAGDWRLPNVREAMSLIDYGRADPALPVDHPFDNIMAGQLYWTSTTNSNGVGHVYFVSFTTGSVYERLKVDYSWVWCVRNPISLQE